MQTYEYIKFKQHIYEGNTADGDDYDYDPKPGLYYNYSASEDQFFSIVRDKDMDSIVSQLNAGKKVDANFPFRMTEHETDINLLKVAIEHAGYVLDTDSDWFCFGIWHQKFDFQNHEAAKLLLELYFKSGGNPIDFISGCVADNMDGMGDDALSELTDWLEEEYRQFVVKAGLLKWKVSGTDNNFEADEPVSSMIALIRDALKTLIRHEYMEVWEDKDGYRIHFQDCEGWPKGYDRWDYNEYTNGKEIEAVCDFFDGLLYFAYGGDEKFSIERI